MHIPGAQKFASTLHYLHTQDAAALFMHIALLLVVYSVATTTVFKSLYDIRCAACSTLNGLQPPGHQDHPLRYWVSLVARLPYQLYTVRAVAASRQQVQESCALLTNVYSQHGLARMLLNQS